MALRRLEGRFVESLRRGIADRAASAPTDVAGFIAWFDDLVAFTQVKMPTQAKLELARNYWDEMGRGAEPGMHGPMLDQLAKALDLHPTIAGAEPASLALGNLLVAFATNRR